ncbi:MAG: N-acetyltransferase [Proteobacteria bacterium]|nr:MAG: N-acetyltransferase [Pseudomonadota bacterium]
MLTIIPVKGYCALGRFIHLPRSIYASDPNWIAPLMLERRLHLSRHNPYFEHAEWAAWLAYRGDRPVGRITAQVDRLRLERYNDQTGSFGMLEGERDPEIFAALFNAAESWLRKKGMCRVEGPFNLSINEECGLLVEGFDSPPTIFMGHAHPYYADFVDACGYKKVKDLVSYRMHPNITQTPTMKKIVERSTRVRHGAFTLRSLKRERLPEEFEILRGIFNDSWQDNWGFVPFTKAEFADVGSMLKYAVDKDFVKIGEIDGEPVSFIVCLPNINEAIRDLDGRLFPFGWLKLLWRIKVSHPKSARVALMGIRKVDQRGLTGTGISLAMIEAIKQRVLERGVTDVEMGWILEDNKSMRSIIEGIGGKIAKRYRIYAKSLMADNATV